MTEGGGGRKRRRRERDTNACIHENTREAPVSLTPCDLNTALCHGIPSRYTRAVPPWNVLHVHKCRTCTIEGKATCHALCHTVSPSALSTYDASSSSPWGWLASLLSPPSPVFLSLFIIGLDASRIFFSLNNVLGWFSLFIGTIVRWTSRRLW